jgi:hypothetical protein
MAIESPQGRGCFINALKGSQMSKAATTAAPLFPVGLTVATPGALEAIAEAEQEPAEFLQRHQHGDWSEMCEDDRRENQFSVDKRLRIFSAYHTSKGEKLWVITEADRSVTTILLPSEY